MLHIFDPASCDLPSRHGRWTEEESAILVPGDIISVKLGDIIPADARLLEGDPLKIDQVMQIEVAALYMDWADIKLFLLTFELIAVCTHRRVPSGDQRPW